MIKKAIGVLMTFVLLFTQLIPVAYAMSDVVSTSTSNLAVSSSTKNPYEKIHVYTHDEDSKDYSSIHNSEELSTAIQALSNIVFSNKKLDTEQTSDIRISVEFYSDFSRTNEYIKFKKQLHETTDRKVRHEIKLKFAEYSEEYHANLFEKNLILLDDLVYDSITPIAFTPFAVLELANNQLCLSDLYNLASEESVNNIILEENSDWIMTENQTIQNTNADTNIRSSEVDSERIISWGQMLEYIGVDRIVETGLYQGDDIWIGIQESGICDKTNPNLADKSITTFPYTGATTAHATAVASVISLIAPEASIVLARQSDYPTLDFFIRIGCDVVNMSMRVGDSASYSAVLDGIYDYQIFYHDIIVVKAAGNNEGTVTPPGKGYNVITVGGVTMTNTNEIVHCGVSQYMPYDGRVKPNICALINYIIPNVFPYSSYPISGDAAPTRATSFAAPVVTACVALMLEAYSLVDDINLTSEQAMALIMSGAEMTDDFEMIVPGLIQLDEKVGAGVFKFDTCLNSNTIVDGFLFSSVAPNTTVFTDSIHLYPGDTIQIALSSLVPVELSYDGTSAEPTDFFDCNIILYHDSLNNAVSFSLLPNASNNEFIRYTATYEGDYYIHVKSSGEPFDMNQQVGIAYTVIEPED